MKESCYDLTSCDLRPVGYHPLLAYKSQLGLQQCVFGLLVSCCWPVPYSPSTLLSCLVDDQQLYSRSLSSSHYHLVLIKFQSCYIKSLLIFVHFRLSKTLSTQILPKTTTAYLYYITSSVLRIQWAFSNAKMKWS